MLRLRQCDERCNKGILVMHLCCPDDRYGCNSNPYQVKADRQQKRFVQKLDGSVHNFDTYMFKDFCRSRGVQLGLLGQEPLSA